MKLTIVIPIKGGRSALVSTLYSLKDQPIIKKKLAEVVILDNCSDEGYRDIIDRWCGRIPRLVYIRNQTDLGRVGNWNRALSVMKDRKSTYGKLMFAGDTLEPGALEAQMEALDFSNSIMSTGAHRVINKEAKHEMRHIDKEVILSPKESLKLSRDKGNWFAGSVALPMFKVGPIEHIMFDESLEWASDWKFWVDVASIGNIHFTPNLLANFDMKNRKGYKRLAGTEKAVKEEEHVKSYVLNKLIECE